MRKRMPVKEMANGKFIDREWFWGICFTTIPHWAHIYFNKVMAYRKQLYEVKHRDQKKLINVSSKWMAKLEQFDFKSKSK